MTIKISFSDKSVRVAVELNGEIESAITELPQRTWVGLTDEQIVDLVIKNAGFPTKLAKAIEAKLKQKNNIGENN